MAKRLDEGSWNVLFLAALFGYKKSQLESAYQHSAVQGAQKIEWSKREEAAFVAAAGAVTRVIETEVRQLRGVFFFLSIIIIIFLNDFF